MTMMTPCATTLARRGSELTRRAAAIGERLAAEIRQVSVQELAARSFQACHLAETSRLLMASLGSWGGKADEAAEIADLLAGARQRLAAGAQRAPIEGDLIALRREVIAFAAQVWDAVAPPSHTGPASGGGQYDQQRQSQE